jgi:hypothetical protein
MWLTGFDAPCCHTMVVDKPMAGHKERRNRSAEAHGWSMESGLPHQHWHFMGTAVRHRRSLYGRRAGGGLHRDRGGTEERAEHLRGCEGQEAAIALVLKQAEALADDWTGEN